MQVKVELKILVEAEVYYDHCLYFLFINYKITITCFACGLQVSWAITTLNCMTLCSTLMLGLTSSTISGSWAMLFSSAC